MIHTHPPQEVEKGWHGALKFKFYSFLTGCVIAWYANSIELKRVVRTALYIPGPEFPTIQDLYIRRCERKAWEIVKDSSHPRHRLFSLLPHGKRYRCIKSDTNRLPNS